MKVSRTRYLTCVAILSAISFVLMVLDFAIPSIMPAFVKLDFSELPALLASFALGPVAGVLVCFIKNLIHLAMTTTSGVGELCNFLLGACFVGISGEIYKHNKSRKGALISSIFGMIAMAVLSFPINLFISYPFYYNFMSKDIIVSMYQAILPFANTIEKCLLVFNVPFNAIKGLLVTIMTFLIYKPLSPIIKGYHSTDKTKENLLNDKKTSE